MTNISTFSTEQLPFCSRLMAELRISCAMYQHKLLDALRNHLVAWGPWTLLIGIENMPKNIINDTLNFFFKTSISVCVISNQNTFRVLFDKIASAHFIWKIYLYFSTGNGQPRERALCQLYRHTFVPYGLWRHSSKEGDLYTVDIMVCYCDHRSSSSSYSFI